MPADTEWIEINGCPSVYHTIPHATVSWPSKCDRPSSSAVEIGVMDGQPGSCEKFTPGLICHSLINCSHVNLPSALNVGWCGRRRESSVNLFTMDDQVFGSMQASFHCELLHEKVLPDEKGWVPVQVRVTSGIKEKESLSERELRQC